MREGWELAALLSPVCLLPHYLLCGLLEDEDFYNSVVPSPV